MPINIHFDEMKAWKHTATLIQKARETNMLYDQLVLNIIRSHPVGAKQVDNHIKRFYIDSGYIIINEEGRITNPENKNDDN